MKQKFIEPKIDFIIIENNVLLNSGWTGYYSIPRDDCGEFPLGE